MELSSPRLEARPKAAPGQGVASACVDCDSSLGVSHFPPPPDQSGDAERERLIDRALAISKADGWLYALMLGVSESYFGAMAVELGHRDVALAVLLTVPMLFGSAAQLLAGPLTACLGSRKRLVVVGASLQTISMLGMYFIAAHAMRSFTVLLAVECVYYLCAMMVGPAWGSWMAALTEFRDRKRYFAHRSAIVQLGLLVAFGAAGAFLHHAGASASAKLHAFSVLYLWAFVFRSASTSMLAWQPDVEAGAPTLRGSVRAVRTAAKTADFRVAGYLAMLMLGANVSVPFFTPYMLHELHMDYGMFAALTAIPIVCKALLFPALHPIAERVGMRFVLVCSGITIALLPALWVAIGGNLFHLALVQALSGAAWGGLEYASYQLLLASAAPDCRVEFLSLASMMSSSGQLIGGLGAGFLRTHLQLGYAGLFLLSTFGRALALPWIWGELPARVRRELPRLFLRVISVRPGLGSLGRPIVSDLPPPPAPSSPITLDAGE